MKAHVQDRLDSITMGTSLNWATAEAMAFGTLLCQGRSIDSVVYVCDLTKSGGLSCLFESALHFRT